MCFKKMFVFAFGLLITAVASATPQSDNPLSKAELSAREAISRDRIASFNVKCLSFFGEEKTLPINVMDVTKNDVAGIFQELLEKNFPYIRYPVMLRKL